MTDAPTIPPCQICGAAALPSFSNSLCPAHFEHWDNSPESLLARDVEHKLRALWIVAARQAHQASQKAVAP